MRLPIFFAAIFCSALAVWAQEQEQKLIDRVLKPNMTLGTPLQNKTFYDGKTFETGRGSANVRTFYFPQRYDAKEFATKDYRAASFWQGDVHFGTKEAVTKTDARDQKNYGTKAVEVQDARESGKSYGTRDYANQREFVAEGKSQKVLDQQGKKKMSIDEVRELLNKNK